MLAPWAAALAANTHTVRPLPASRSSDLRPNLHSRDVRLFKRRRKGLTGRIATSAAVALTVAPDRSPHARNGTSSLVAAVCSSLMLRSAALCNSCLSWEGWKPSGGVKCSHTMKASAGWRPAVVPVSEHELLGSHWSVRSLTDARIPAAFGLGNCGLWKEHLQLRDAEHAS